VSIVANTDTLDALGVAKNARIQFGAMIGASRKSPIQYLDIGFGILD